MQIYQDMNIGTAKVTKKEMQGIEHYMIDVISPEKRYSVSEYKKEAEEKIEQILKKNKVPIVVGGTGLYIDSLIYGIDFQNEEFDENYRNELNEIAEKEGLDKLYKMALEIDENAMQKISPNDKKRIIRVLEIYNKTGKTKTEQEKLSRQNPVKYNYKVFAIDMERKILYERINNRVDQMIEEGLIEEVKSIIEKYDTFPTAMQGLGYKETVEFLEGRINKEEMIESIKKETRHYAKRQLTWFRKNKETIWLDGTLSKDENIQIILETIKI